MEVFHWLMNFASSVRLSGRDLSFFQMDSMVTASLKCFERIDFRSSSLLKRSRTACGRIKESWLPLSSA